MDIIHVIDFEGNKENGISEFGITTLHDFEIVECRGRCCSKDFFSNFQVFSDLRKTGVFCAHSAQTEDNLLRHYWASPGLVPTFTDGNKTLSWGPWIDTKIAYRKLFKGLRGYELNFLIASFELGGELVSLARQYCPPEAIKFHRAQFDSLATALLVRNLNNYFSNVSSMGLLSLGH